MTCRVSSIQHWRAIRRTTQNLQELSSVKWRMPSLLCWHTQLQLAILKWSLLHLMQHNISLRNHMRMTWWSWHWLIEVKFTPFMLAMHPLSLKWNKNCLFAWLASGSYRIRYTMRFWIPVSMRELCPSQSTHQILYRLSNWYAWKNGGLSVPNWQIVKTSW